MTTQTAPYRGRFAPSPSGPLHLGSLVCALGSYLDARAHHGQWLVRIEDIDPPREQAGADKLILDCLYQHGLIADQAPNYQSNNSQRYRQRLTQLQQHGLAYHCDCTRKRLAQLQGRYDNQCRNRNLETEQPCAIRLNLERAKIEQIDFKDRAQGPQHDKLQTAGDFIIHRKDGLFAYQLAVSCDDAAQGITDIVRGCDLLGTTAKQIALLQLQNSPIPRYLHMPVITNKPGQKLSKQNHAPAVDNAQALNNLKTACRAFGLDTRSAPHNIEALLHWATERWLACIPNLNSEVLLSELN